jgi:dTMP kinase
MGPKFVTLEGLEGSGKSTQIARLEQHLVARGIDVTVTREPGGTPLAERIRALLLEARDRSPSTRSAPPLEGASDPGPWSEAFLMEAARADLVTRVIEPSLESGKVVLCDRYADSTLAYQGGGRGLDAALLAAMNRAATGGRIPDLTLLFDLDPAIGLARRAGATAAPNRLDLEPEAFHARVRARYRELAAAEPSRFVVLEARTPEDELERAVWDAVEGRLGPVAP